MAGEQASLLEPDLPDGLRYQDHCITAGEEAHIVASIAHVEFSAFEMRGVVARRRVAFFGRTYNDGGNDAVPDIPAFLLPFRDRVAAWAGLDGSAFGMVLINKYPPGAPIGWHRDAPQYDIVAGLSLLSRCRMMFRPYVRPSARAGSPGPRRATHELRLEPRSAYLLAGPVRTAFEHHIPPLTTLRYSITFRTLRAGFL